MSIFTSIKLISIPELGGPIFPASQEIIKFDKRRHYTVSGRQNKVELSLKSYVIAC